MSFDELGAPGTAIAFEPISVSEESTVVAEFVPDADKSSSYQSEAALEAAFITLLQGQAYGYLPIASAAELEANARIQTDHIQVLKRDDVTTLVNGLADGARRAQAPRSGHPRGVNQINSYDVHQPFTEWDTRCSSAPRQ
ncbi:MAG: hypothetical protein LH477_10430 [Nocardioides sp.]|nr:hypothetical protein [Nocardioides sp.]